MKYQWLLFDADGTLFDYDRAEVFALRRTFDLSGLSFQPSYAEIYRQINAAMWLQFEQGELTQAILRTRRFEKLLEQLELAADPGHFSELYLQQLAQGTFLIEGTEALLEALEGKVKLALITNGLSDVQRPRLKLSPIGRYFTQVIISEEVGAAKPDRRIFDIAFQRMDHPAKEQVLIIGDSLTSDMKGGSVYGIDTCWFNPEGKPANSDLSIRYEIRQLQELLPILDLS